MPKPSAAQKPAAPRVLAGTVSITRQVHFNAAHRLHNPTKSQRWNEEKYAATLTQVAKVMKGGTMVKDD